MGQVSHHHYVVGGYGFDSATGATVGEAEQQLDRRRRQLQFAESGDEAVGAELFSGSAAARRALDHVNGERSCQVEVEFSSVGGYQGRQAGAGVCQHSADRCVSDGDPYGVAAAEQFVCDSGEVPASERSLARHELVLFGSAAKLATDPLAQFLVERLERIRPAIAVGCRHDRHCGIVGERLAPAGTQDREIRPSYNAEYVIVM